MLRASSPHVLMFYDLALPDLGPDAGAAAERAAAAVRLGFSVVAVEREVAGKPSGDEGRCV